MIAQDHAVWALLKQAQICQSSAKISILFMTDSTTQVRQILEDFLATSPENPLIVVLGPTASGKTAFSIGLTKLLQSFEKMAEVVNADSRQFYRGFDIGTAKITQAEMQGVPHHLIDVLDPMKDCTISWYKCEVERVLREIYIRGNIPLLVGGSMLYTAAIIDGLEPLPPVDPAIRERLGKEYDADGGKTLFAKLTEIDPETAASFPMQNKVYVVRAMEIYEGTGKTKSSQKKTTPGVYDLLMFGMNVDREALATKISARTKLMLERGWIDEVKKLREQGIRVTDPAMKSVGYHEIFEALESGNIDTSKLASTIDSGTRAYAKRHMTWWKRDPRIHWVKPSL